MRLLEADYSKALDVWYAAGEVEGPIAFQEPVLHALRELVPCDVLTFHEWSTSLDRILVYAAEPIGEMTPEIRSAHRRLGHEDPVRPAVGARRLSDVVSPPREREEIGHVAEGRTNSEIAFLLAISPETVRNHLENAYEKLGVHTRTRAVAATFGRRRVGAFTPKPE